MMKNSTPTQDTPVRRFESLNWVATEPLLRDQVQSHRLHEPDHLTGTIDPITGRDIGDLRGHPSLVDGNLTIYFENEVTKAEFEHTPLNHPYGHSVGEPSAVIDRGG